VEFEGTALPGSAGGMPLSTEEQYFDPALLPPPESEIDFPIEPVNGAPQDQEAVPPPDGGFRGLRGCRAPSSSIPTTAILYHVLAYGRAKRYGVGVGRAGFAWAGDAKVGMKRRWPRWVPPREMVDRDERAREWVNGQPGGPDNPLGARALYLYANGEDTLYRIHGTNEPHTIGKAMSSGCIRMLNEDIANCSTT
jgi:lipoprotein-anchoring transpeptidase ErfK/SrfK